MLQNDSNSNPIGSNLNQSSVRVSPSQEIEPRVYSAPRRFDILTILCVSSVYAVAFAIATSAKVPMAISMSLILLLTFIGLAQAVLWQGKRPRLASMLVGTISSIVWMWIMVSTNPKLVGADQLVPILLATVIFGSIVGYVLGAGIGGLFLVIEGVRDSIFPNHKSYARSESSTPFDD